MDAPCRIWSRNLTVDIDPKGSHVLQIHKNEHPVLWQGDRDSWGSCPILFPFIGRFFKNRYRADERIFQAQCHGFINERGFKTISQDEHRIVMNYTSDDSDFRMYPYRFMIEASYSLDGDSLHIGYRVCNEDDRIIHFGLGLHPGFLTNGSPYQDHSILFGVDSLDEYLMNPSCLFSGVMGKRTLQERKLSLDHALFANDALIFGNWGGKVILQDGAGERMVSMETRDFPILTIWSWPTKTQPFVCIEPCTSVPGHDGVIEELSQRNDYITLGKGQEREFRIVMRF